MSNELFLTTEKNVVDMFQSLRWNIKNLIYMGWETGNVIWAFPNIRYSKFLNPKFQDEIRKVAEIESIDLTIIIADTESIRGGEQISYGISCPNKIVVTVFLNEHFQDAGSDIKSFLDLIKRRII